MTPNSLERPLCFFDLETTGVDPAADRIVSIAILKLRSLDPLRATTDPADSSQFTTLINPDRPIPPEATAVHGITDEMVRLAPRFKDVSWEILKFIQGCDLAGFNIMHFDAPLLDEEFSRAGDSWATDGVRFLDVCNIFRKKEARNLTAAVRFYCGREMADAHNAVADVLATIDVLRGQLRRYPDLQAMPMDDLAAFSQMGRAVDLAGKIGLNDAGVPVYNFGKHNGKPVSAEHDYAYWMLGQNFPASTKRALRKILCLN